LFSKDLTVIVVDSLNLDHLRLLAQHSCHQQDPLAEILLLASGPVSKVT